MTKKKIVIWWVYVISTITLFLFAGPALISEQDTSLVLLGMALFVFFGVWSYYLWLRSFVKILIEGYREL